MQEEFKAGEEYIETMAGLNPKFCLTIFSLMTAAGYQPTKKTIESIKRIEARLIP